MTEHLCHIKGCGERVMAVRLMCRPHWSMTPPSLRQVVMRHYRRGQCADKRPSGDWLRAARAALTYVESLSAGA